MLSSIKNITFSLLPVLGSVFFLSSCSGKSDEDILIKSLEESLVASNTSINNSSSTIMRTLADKRTEWDMKEWANFWYPKAEQIIKLSQDTYNYIGALKKLEIIDSDKAKELFTYLLKYKETVLTVDSSISVEFSKNLPLSIDSFNKTEISQKNFYNTYFKKSGSALSSAILTKFQNEIKVAENRMTAFCNTKVGSTIFWFDSYSTLVGQNSNQVNPGEDVIINAGIGAFSKSTSPVININGRNILIGEEGFATYKIKASRNPGKYSIPVSIDFTNPYSGKIESKKIDVEYTVAKPCN